VYSFFILIFFLFGFVLCARFRVFGVSPVGKLGYMAPEVFARHAHDARATDLWSCAIILFVMLCRVFPFDRPTLDDDRFVHACSGRINLMLAAWGKPTLDEHAIDLFAKLFAPAENRATAEQLLQHPFCTGAQAKAQQPQQQPQQTPSMQQTQQQQQQHQQAAMVAAASSAAAAVAPAAAASVSASASRAPIAAAAASGGGGAAMDTAEPGS